MSVIPLRQTATALAFALLFTGGPAAAHATEVDGVEYPDLGAVFETESHFDQSAGSIDEPGPPGSPADLATAALIAGYQQAVDEVLDSSNAYDPRLSDLYYGLATALHQTGDLGNAIKAYDQSLYIVRVNHGLYSVNQADILRGLASCYESLQQWQDASDRYRHLLWLHQQSHGGDSPLLIPVLQEVGSWYLKAYNNHPGRPGNYLSESERLTRAGLHLTGHHEHSDRNSTVALLRNLAAGQYLWAQHLRRHPPLDSSFGFESGNNRMRAAQDLDLAISTSYRVGRSAYEKLVEIMTLTPDLPAEDVAAAMAELGDWHLRYGYHNAADESYRHAYQYLVRHDDPSSAEHFFASPSLIKPLWPVSHEIEVVANITVDSRGRATELDIQEVGNEALRQRVQNNLRSARFRPSLHNGEPETAPYRLTQRVALQ